VESAARFRDADKANIIREKDGVFRTTEAYGYSRELGKNIRSRPSEDRRQGERYSADELWQMRDQCQCYPCRGFVLVEWLSPDNRSHAVTSEPLFDLTLAFALRLLKKRHLLALVV